MRVWDKNWDKLNFACHDTLCLHCIAIGMSTKVKYLLFIYLYFIYLFWIIYFWCNMSIGIVYVCNWAENQNTAARKLLFAIRAARPWQQNTIQEIVWMILKLPLISSQLWHKSSSNQLEISQSTVGQQSVSRQSRKYFVLLFMGEGQSNIFFMIAKAFYGWLA